VTRAILEERRNERNQRRRQQWGRRRRIGGKVEGRRFRACRVWLGEGLMAFVEAGEEEQVQGQQKGEEEVEEGRKLGRVR